MTQIQGLKYLIWLSIDLFQQFLGMVSEAPGGRLNKKDGLTRYGDSHVKDKTS